MRKVGVMMGECSSTSSPAVSSLVAVKYYATRLPLPLDSVGTVGFLQLDLLNLLVVHC